MADEKLAGVDQALSELGKSDDEIAAVRHRFAGAEPANLESVDADLDALSQGVDLERAPADAHATQTGVPKATGESWDGETTDVEILDESDFILLVEESDLEELEKVGEEDARVSLPPPVPQQEEEGDSFFKKLFGGRRSSNRP
ncbi:MAG: hypothetical protein PVI24_08370 [Myxococcales bacterium]|jgi:hypothetical protein